jgi:hypothetical protein
MFHACQQTSQQYVMCFDCECTGKNVFNGEGIECRSYLFLYTYNTLIFYQITWCDPKVPEIWILPANGYNYKEIPISISSYTLHESAWQATSSWVVGFLVGKRISIAVLPWVCDFVMADLREQHICLCFKLGKILCRNAPNVEASFWWQQFRPDSNLRLV